MGHFKVLHAYAVIPAQAHGFLLPLPFTGEVQGRGPAEGWAAPPQPLRSCSCAALEDTPLPACELALSPTLSRKREREQNRATVSA